MLHESLGFEVGILAGIDGKIIPDYDSEGSNTKFSIEVKTGTLICPRITIYSDFNWYDADGLYVTIYYASHTEQLHVWVPKPDASVLANEGGWSFQIPGKNVQDPETQALVGWGYQFVDLQHTQDCDLSIDCPDYKKSDEYLGMIVVGLKRRKLSGTISSGIMVRKGRPDLNIPQSVCRLHSRAVRKIGATEAIKHTLDLISTEPYQMGSLIIHPQPQDAFADLDTGVSRSNNWMNTSFLFRDREQLWKYIEGAEKPDPGKSFLAESRSVSANLQAVIDQSAHAASSAVDPPRGTRSKRNIESVEARTPSREDSSRPSSVGHQAKKSKKKRTEASFPTTLRGTPQKSGKEIPAQKHKSSQRKAASKSHEATEKPTPKAPARKSGEPEDSQRNTAAQGANAKPTLQTANSVTDEPDPMNAIHKEIGILRKEKIRDEEEHQEQIKPLENQIEPLKEQIKRLEEQVKHLEKEHQQRQDRFKHQIQAKVAEYTQMVEQ